MSERLNGTAKFPRSASDFVSLPWACAHLGISRRTLNNWLTTPGVWSQHLRPVWRVSYKTVLVPRAGVLALAAWRKEQLAKRS